MVYRRDADGVVKYEDVDVRTYAGTIDEGVWRVGSKTDNVWVKPEVEKGRHW